MYTEKRNVFTLTLNIKTLLFNLSGGHTDDSSTADKDNGGGGSWCRPENELKGRANTRLATNHGMGGSLMGYGMGGELSRRLQRGLMTPTSSLRMVGQLTSAAAGCGNKGYAGVKRRRWEEGGERRGEERRGERDGRKEAEKERDRNWRSDTDKGGERRRRRETEKREKRQRWRM